MLRESKTPSLYAELFHRHAANPILTARDWPYPAHTVFNAGACQVGDETVLLVRVEDRRGHSHLTVARSNDGVSNWHIDSKPSFAPDPANYPEEAWGVEDPRLTWVEDRERMDHRLHGLLAQRTAGVAGGDERLHHLYPARPGHASRGQGCRRLSPPLRQPLRDDSSAGFRGQLGAHIWLSFSPDLTHWGDHHILLHARRGAWWDANKIGLSPPPLETPEGWLLLYHGVRVTAGRMPVSSGAGLARPGRSVPRPAPQRRMDLRARDALRAPGGRQRRGVSLRLDPGQGESAASRMYLRRRQTPAWPWPPPSSPICSTAVSAAAPPDTQTQGHDPAGLRTHERNRLAVQNLSRQPASGQKLILTLSRCGVIPLAPDSPDPGAIPCP